MTVRIARITFPHPCMDCDSYTKDCDHLARIVDGLRKFALDFKYDKDIELNVDITCHDQRLCQ